MEQARPEHRAAGPRAQTRASRHTYPIVVCSALTSDAIVPEFRISGASAQLAGNCSMVAPGTTVVPGTTQLTARKGSFGHGMSVCGGWELTAQHLGFAKGILHPVNIEEEEIHPSIRAMQDSLVGHDPASPVGKVAGKLNMGVGGVNSCVISRLWDQES